MFQITDNSINSVAINFYLNTFKFLSITLNSIYNLAIYIKYAAIISFEWILIHFNKNHNIKLNLNEIIICLNINIYTMSFSAAEKWISNTWILSKMINNMLILMKIFCNECIYSAINTKIMKNHFNKKYKKMKWLEKSKKCYVQLLFKRWLKKYIQIKDCNEMKMNINNENEWKRALKLKFERNKMKINAFILIEYNNIQLLKAFIAKNW